MPSKKGKVAASSTVLNFDTFILGSMSVGLNILIRHSFMDL